VSIYLSIDLGTTGCRSILFNETLCPLAYAYEEYGLITPREGWVEQDAELWWELTLRTAKSAIQKASLTGGEIDGISISSQGITVVPVDRDLKPLRSAMTWLDTRAEEETQELISVYGLDTISVPDSQQRY
jgi:xylulokinase